MSSGNSNNFQNFDFAHGIGELFFLDASCVFYSSRQQNVLDFKMPDPNLCRVRHVGTRVGL